MWRLSSLTKPSPQLAFVLAAACLFCPPWIAHADSVGGPGGTWPKSWPKELEPLRKQASTWVGGQVMNTRYEIPFTDRKQFEAAWPHIVSLKSKGASITLISSANFYGKSDKAAGVWILLPLESVSSGSLSVTRIVLIVDGEIVDMNRIRLPADTPIVDQRFKGKHKR